MTHPSALPLFRQSPFSMVIYDLTGRALAVNAAFEKLFGLTIDSVPPDYNVRTDPELERHGALPLVERAFRGEVVRVGPIYYDAPARHGSGKPTWTYGYFFPLETGGERYIALQHVDLTELVETERALRMANDRYGALVSALTQMVWSTDANGMIDDMPVWRELTGQTVEEVRGEGWTNALHPGDRDNSREVWWRAYQSRGVYDNEYRLRMKDGTYRWVRARAVPVVDDAQRIVEWVGTLEDVHDARLEQERKAFLERATLVVHESLDWNATLRALVRHCTPFLADYASVDLVDPAGTVSRVETAHVDPRKEEIVRELWRRYPYRADEQFGVPAVVRTGEPQFIPAVPVDQIRAFARDAEHAAMLAELAPRSYLCVPLAVRGRVLGALSLVFSDSGRVYTQADLELAQEVARRSAIALDNARLFREAEEANRAKAEFLAMMSHELRTPLNAIAGYAELLSLQLHGPLTAEQAQHVARIQRSQHHLSALVNDVLNFARIEAGNVRYNIGAMSLAPILADAEAAIRPQLQARQLAFDNRSNGALPQVLGDAEKVLQILLNLLSNAVKFTGAGGVISIATEVGDAHVHVLVSDTGRGIPADKLGVIFEPFVQLERSLTRPAEGMGLGLAISADLARGMNGGLTVTSAEGQGTTFRLTLARA